MGLIFTVIVWAWRLKWLLVLVSAGIFMATQALPTLEGLRGP